MKRTVLMTGAAALMMALMAPDSRAWERMDGVIAVVNDRPIVESEVNIKLEQLRRFKKIPAGKVAFHKSRVLDMFIEDSLFVQTAEEESIIISEKKIDDFVDKMKKRLNIASDAEFKEKLEKKDRISYAEYRDQIRSSMTKEMVMSIAVGVSPPSEQQALEWYRKNSGKVGFEFNTHHIFMRLRNNSIAEERRVNREMNAVLAKVRGGMSFENAARQYSEDASTKNSGGARGWEKLTDIDRILAMQIYGLNRPGQLSGVVKSSAGYHIVKFNGKRTVQYESIRDIIFNILYNERLGEQMVKWAEQKRKESDVKIYMADYVM
ncbi:MAG TPA: peptidylprolyl isomerase [Spirochaetota bacterium]|nr:peptidylprolyl isomerase [Spirochaetota bacterium]